METILECSVLYWNGEISNKLVKGKRIIAIVVENTKMALKNNIRSSHRDALLHSEMIKFSNGYYGYLALKPDVEIWVKNRTEINLTIAKLQTIGVNVDLFPSGEALWTAGSGQFHGQIVNSSSGCSLTQELNACYLSRAAISNM